MDFDAVWDAWTAARHAGCGGWRYDPDPDGGTATCACGTIIPHPAAEEAVTPMSPPDCAGSADSASSTSPARAASTLQGAGSPAGPADPPTAGPATRTSPPAPTPAPTGAPGGTLAGARFTRAAKRTGPGMIRKPPPGGAA